jgi:pyridoxal phosphate enzyme (YggS family)
MDLREESALRQAIDDVRSRIADACDRGGRQPKDVVLVAVTKKVPPEAVASALRGGIKDFGENYASELSVKAPQIAATWHFLGALQRGTAGRVSGHADVIHSVAPGDALPRVARRAAEAGKTIRCLVQIDFIGARQGSTPGEAEGVVANMVSLAGVEIVGLMTIPPLAGSAEAARPYFAGLRALRDRLGERWPQIRELSMGMSADYEVAVEEGATMVRVGTALFGPRPQARGRGN